MLWHYMESVAWGASPDPALWHVHSWYLFGVVLVWRRWDRYIPND